MGTVDQKNTGFMIAELIVVIVILGILSTIAIVSYNNWNSTTARNVMKSDLNGAAAAMESTRNFSNAYPGTIPSSFTASKDVTLALSGGADAGEFCINATNVNFPTLALSFDSKTYGLREVACP